MAENNKIIDEAAMIVKPLTVELILEEWSKTYNPDGKPDWSHLFPYYAEDIVFHDSIQRLKGKEKFEGMCNRLSKRCKSLAMEIKNIVKNDNVVFMEWRMVMSFRIFPKKPLHGSSRLTLNADGKIIEQRDYYDLWGDIYDGIPIVRRIYRWFMRVFFG